MDKAFAYNLYIRLIAGRNYDKTGKFISEYNAKLKATGTDTLHELPMQYSNFVLSRSIGDELAYAFALLHEFKMATSDVRLAIIQDSIVRKPHYAVAYDERGYQRFCWPGKALETHLVANYYSMTEVNLFDLSNLGPKGQIYIVNVYDSSVGEKHFFREGEFLPSRDCEDCISR